MTNSILLRSFAPLPSTLTIALPDDATASTLIAHLAQSHSLDVAALSTCRLTTLTGRRLSPDTSLFDVRAQHESSTHPLFLELRPLTLGGKGGFGSMLRAQGGKMSSSKRGQENTDSCRDLNGRRLSTMKQAQTLAAYLESKPEREKALDEKQRRKFEKLERMLGRRPKDAKEVLEAASRMEEEGDEFDIEEGSKSPEAEAGAVEDKGEGSSRRPLGDASTTTKPAPLAGGKRERIEDHTFVEESREIVEGVRSAVAAAMMKKRKLKKASAPPKGAAQAAGKTQEEGKGKAVAA